MIPTIEVSHLPASSSFYAAVMQPLGIHFLFASPSKSLHFGPAQSSEILFTLTESPSPKPSTLTLTASNSTQVTNFHTLALEANTFQSTNLIQQSSDAAVAKTTDLDGNLLEVRYARSSPKRGSVQASPTTITTASTAKEARRVLDWQRDVARSVSAASPPPSRDASLERAIVVAAPAPAPAPSQAPRSQAPPSQAPPPQPAPQTLVRSATTPIMTAVYNEITSALPDRIGEGLSAQAILGTLIGAAAGAAVAYAMVKSEEPEPPRPQLVTYYTAPAAAPMPPAPAQPVVEVARSKAPSGAGSRAGSNSGRSQRYVVRYNAGGGSRLGSVQDGYLGRVDEERSMHYSSYERDAQTGPSLAPGGALSYVSKSSRHTESRGIGHERPLTVVSGAPSMHSEARRSHVSAKSDATVKPAKSHSKAGTSSRAGTERERGERSQHGSVMSVKSERKSTHTSMSERARRVPLPESVVGSVAPSDSVSNIGMKSHYSRRDVY